MTESAFRYYKRKCNGLCTHCGRVPPVPGAVECEQCQEKKRQRQHRRYEKNKTEINRQNYTWTKAKRAWAAENGMCTKCFHEPAEKGYRTCWRCRANGRSYNVYKPRTDEEKARDAAYYKQRRGKRIAEGVCVRCGKRQAKEDIQSCGICQAKYNRLRRESAHKAGVLPQHMRGDGLYCFRCCKPVCNGEKLCAECYENARAQMLAITWKAREYA